MKVALTIAGSDSVGGAGIQADLKAFASVGVHGCAAVACITSQNTLGISEVLPVRPESLRSQIVSVMEDLAPAAAKTGAIFTAENGAVVAELFESRDIPLVVDPVLAATTGASLAKEELVAVLKRRLVPICALVTPNRREAEALTGLPVEDIGQAARAADLLLSSGASAALIKGIVEGDNVSDYLVTADGGSRVLSSSRLEGEFHGTGCVLSALIAAHLALGDDLCTAVMRARGATFDALERALPLGKGIRMIDPLMRVREDADRYDVLERLSRTGPTLERILNTRLLPEVGSNLGFSIRSPSRESDIAAFTGRIVRDGDRPRVVGCPKFGASKHIARIILAASAHDHNLRSAMNVRFTEENLAACKDAGLSSATFSREEEPEGVSSMSWGVDLAIRRHGAVPDVIWDAGGSGKEPMIRVIGRDPEDVVQKVLRISDGLRK